MTLAIVQEPAASGAEGIDLEAWRAWLGTAVEASWRSGEWDGQALLFTGDVDNPRTRAYSCKTLACSTVVHTNSFCARCTKRMKATGESAEEFAASYVPPRLAAASGQDPTRCAVQRAGRRCGYPASARGLCIDHYNVWSAHSGRRAHTDAELAEWAATSKVAIEELVPVCAVPGCVSAIAPRRILCAYHHRARAAAARHCEEGPDAASWAQDQIPFLLQHQFSLRPLDELMRLEFLYALQQRDARGAKLDTQCVRHMARTFTGMKSLLLIDRADALALVERASNNTRAHVKEFFRHAKAGYEQAMGRGPRDGEVWDAVSAKLMSRYSRSGVRYNQGTIDFTKIAQPWLRHATLEWARVTDPDTFELRRTLDSCVRASMALQTRRGGGHDPAVLTFADMDAVVEAFKDARKPNGERYAFTHRRSHLTKFFRLLDFGRKAGLLEELAGGFARHQSHMIPAEERDDDEAGKAIPELVIDQLDAHLNTLGADFPYGQLAPADVQLMFQTAYVVLRDTGRRPVEVCSLKTNYLEIDGDDVTLIWDNHKKKRYRRRLPITTGTARAIQRWLQRREQLDLPPKSRPYLFSAISADTGIPHLIPGNLARAIRAWVDALPMLHSGNLDPDGVPLPYDTAEIFPYAFRHSYAQRHADAGIRPDVLRDLMDHRSVDTTMGHYKVSLERKRAAVETLRLQVVDRSGKSTPMASATAYEARSVAVPYGNCTEPTNIKAGGKSCPLRFQCAGCGFYRPDPSYLPAIEEHLHQLRTDREMAGALDAADFVTRNLTDQIDAYTEVAEKMHKQLAELPSHQQAEIEEAARIMRKARAADGHTLLPLTVVNRAQGAS
ncbi:site-specific integrase [Streptomyces sp. NPDC005407]|uniref:tyrosine-type recombinase/integrase n=1 Tax=Streptomyces sp. NPDC005407 TaxID=3155340 RepID=UPI0033A18B45